MEARVVRIYSPVELPRLRYITGIIFGDILGIRWEIVTDKRKLGKYPAINYSTENISGAFNICPDDLLFETGIHSRDISVVKWKGLPVFFQANSQSDFPFDIFAASFYLVSRYEEYLDFESDEYGRYKASSSIAFRNGFLGIPVVDLWARELALALLQKFRTLTFKRNEFRVLLTIDADLPFVSQGESIFRSIGGLFRNLRVGNTNTVDMHRNMMKGEKEHYEVFDYITETIERYNLDATFFFPVGSHTKYDKHPYWKNEGYRNLIYRIARKHKTGLHPSFYSSENATLISSEVSRLKSITNSEIKISRFHLIRFFMPASYHAIISNGIEEDYSMGYPEEPGFRAGIARPYLYYDLSREEETPLKIIPFQLMDSSLFNNKKPDPFIAKEVILNLMNETRSAGGTFVSIWHNTSLLEKPGWQGWRDVFEFMIKNHLQ